VKEKKKMRQIKSIICFRGKKKERA